MMRALNISVNNAETNTLRLIPTQCITQIKKDGLLTRIYQERLEIRKNKKFNDKQLAKLGIVASFGERLRYRIKTYNGWKSGKY